MTRTTARPGALAPGRADRGYRIERPANLASGGKAAIYIYAPIDSWGAPWGVSAAEFVAELLALSADEIDLHLNSGGGDYFEAVAMRAALAAHSATITVYVDGLAASAASVLATVGERVVMAQGAQMMIHEASTFAIGNAEDLRAAADLLDKVGADIAAMYAERAGGDPESWRAAMRVETWYTADEAVAAGLANEVAVAGRASADQLDEPAAQAAARWVATWRHPGRAAAPAPEIPAPAAAAVPPALAAVFDPERFRSAIREAKKK